MTLQVSFVIPCFNPGRFVGRAVDAFATLVMESYVTNSGTLVGRSAQDAAVGWDGMENAVRRSPSMLAATETYPSLARLVLRTVIGAEQYVRVVGASRPLRAGPSLTAFVSVRSDQPRTT
jgi:hypothetical protein